MAGQAPFFITGANARIMVAGIPLALATDLTYTITVKHSAPHTLGLYEIAEVQPLAYDVSGSFTVIRYHRHAVDTAHEVGLVPPSSVSNTGNGIGAWQVQGGNAIEKMLMPQMPFGVEGSAGRAYDSLDPSKLKNAIAFDIEVHQRLPNGKWCPFGVLRNCRITGADFRLSKRSAAIQVFTFIAQYADEDSFRSDQSGVGPAGG